MLALRLPSPRLALALACLALAGCGRATVEGICQRVCDCERCPDADLKDCIDDATRLQQTAEGEGCGDAFDALLACLDDNLLCRDGKIDEVLSGKACKSQAEAVDECT